MKRMAFFVFIIIAVSFINSKAEETHFKLDTLIFDGQVIIKKVPIIIQKKIKIPKGFSKKYALQAYRHSGDTILVKSKNSLTENKQGSLLFPKVRTITSWQAYVYKQGKFYKFEKIIKSFWGNSATIVLFLFFDLLLLILAGRSEEEYFLKINKRIWRLFWAGCFNLTVGSGALILFKNGLLSSYFFAILNIAFVVVAIAIFIRFFWVTTDLDASCQMLDYSSFFEIVFMIFITLMMVYPARYDFTIAQNHFPYNTLVFVLISLALFFLLAVFELKLKVIISNWRENIIKAIKILIKRNKANLFSALKR